MASGNEQRIRSFIAAFNANDLERILAFFTADAVYHNIPIAPVQGTAAIRAVLQGFLGMASAVDWILHQIAETPEGVVLTERTDRFEVGGRWIELPNMPAFEPSCFQQNSSSAIASSGVCIGITATGVSRSESFAKYSAVTMLKPRITARRVSSSAMRGMLRPAVG